MKLITISGVDGSGKSTQVKMLKNYLESQGKRVFYFHAIEFGLAKKINDFRLKYCLICRYLDSCKRSSGEKSVTHANFFQLFLRRIFFRIDLARFKKLLAKLQAEGYDAILSDRYFYDTVVNINFLDESEEELFCEKHIPKPDMALYLEIRPRQIMERERKPEQGLDYLRAKVALFRSNAPRWGMITINADREKEDIFAEIKEKTRNILV